MTRILTLTHGEATKLANASGKSYEASTCDVNDIDEGYTTKASEILQAAMGETNCYRSDDGDIWAWWQEELEA